MLNNGDKLSTLRDRFVLALTHMGEKEVKKTHKYLVFTKDKGVNNSHYYIGKSGSLRIGPTVAGSLPVSSKFKIKLLEIANALEAGTLAKAGDGP